MLNKMKYNYGGFSHYFKACINNKIFICFFISLICTSFIFLIILLLDYKKENLHLIRENARLTELFRYGMKNVQKYGEFMEASKNIFKYRGLANCLFDTKESHFCLYKFLVPKKVRGKNRVLIGPQKDGGYVLLDDFANIKIAYSFGIDGEIEFDNALAQRDIDVYMYDHTINFLPYNRPKFHWKKIGLSGNYERNRRLKTLEEILKDNGHLNEKNMILKIDIEYNEWNALLNTPTKILKQFKYIVIEYHFKNDMDLYYKVLKKLLQTHEIFYLHCNNCGGMITFGNFTMCFALEVSYIIKEGNKFDKDDSTYPIPNLDFINCKQVAKLDYNLTLLKFFSNKKK